MVINAHPVGLLLCVIHEAAFEEYLQTLADAEYSSMSNYVMSLIEHKLYLCCGSWTDYRFVSETTSKCWC